ncbi:MULTISPECIES: hypothetical protein [unclassified Haladaptatus]|uniref:hypothetical protein n=1 Tax=unclassified Haladaptatus TaxID=2622732 RepID=UPI00209BC5D8|nr:MULTISPECIES: hypothetical protein [unclassified Haladaptatus]MCO8242681.1 hypothetical protein [Haladaptatus sp. AB643]MCO8252440.1 hypothetical protein [Haladaptatus sp. AB618]
MNSLLFDLAAFSFITQLVALYIQYRQEKPRIVLATWSSYTLFWAYLAVTQFFELRFATIGLGVLLVAILALTAVTVHRQLRNNRTQSA